MPPQAKRSLLLALALQFFMLIGCSGDKLPAAILTAEDHELASAIGAAISQGTEAIWASCATCHGFDAEGSQQLNAPALVNQDAWYLKRQLQNFRSGTRGTETANAPGVQMAAMAKSLPDGNAIDELVDYIGDLGSSIPAATISGDIENGRDHYDMICGACHGPGAEGNELLNAPRLAGIDDWYLLRQYRNFANGLRGGHVDDKYGRQMQMMSSALPDDEVIDNVFAYIQDQAARH